MSYLVIGFSHKNTDIQTREKLAFPSEENKDSFLKQILEDDIINEAILLSTCNRVEIITAVSDIDTAAKSIIRKLSKYSGIDFDDLYEREDETHIQRAYSIDEIKEILSKTGFEVLDIADTNTNEDVTDTSERIMFIGKKV